MIRIKRHDGRRANQLRPASIEVDFLPAAMGSCLISIGQTRVICTASLTPGVPEFLEGKGRGWVTAEYGMLPASTGQRTRRPVSKQDGRATEIQRLIGRVLRGVIHFERLGENTIHLDCDVLQADGGTRTASITGAYVALARALNAAQQRQLVQPNALAGNVSAVSVGILDGSAVLDLDYHEDSRAEVDMNVALTGAGKFIEVQGSAEKAAFSVQQLNAMLDLARRGCRELSTLQRRAIAQQTKARA